MQAHFQQRQELEKDGVLSLDEELRRVDVDRTGSALSDSSVTGGKVRQFFQERRCPRSKSHGTNSRGWDKSFPLEPLNKDKETKTGVKSVKNNRSIPYVQNISAVNLDEINSNLRLKDKFSFNKSSGFPSEAQVLSNINSTIFTKLPNIGGPLISEKKTDTHIGEDFNAQKGITSNNGDMSPTKDVSAITKGVARLPVSPKKKIEKPTCGVIKEGNSERTQISRRVPKANVTVVAPPSKTVTTATPTIPVIKSLKPPAVKPHPLKAKQLKEDQNAKTEFDPKSRPVPPGLVQCSNCYRSFAPDRIGAHKKVCLKTAKKKRKAFDPAKQRLEGTEAGQFLKKAPRTSAPPPPATKKSNWRKKHEEFINNIRLAKLAQEHVAAGGKLSDLPPPPPMDTSDLTPCPHCGRKFNEQAAERHIPRCADLNKRTPPKRTPPKKR